MKFSRSGAAFVASAAVLVGVVTASAEGQVEVEVDSLHSKRNLGKRFIDEQGNYNICEFALFTAISFESHCLKIHSRLKICGWMVVRMIY